MAGIEARFRVDWPGFSLGVDLTLPGQGVTALFGQSGSGKTTLLRCIAGLERAPQGRLVVQGEVWQDAEHWLPTHRRPIGYVFQEASLFAHLTVLGNLRYGMRRSGHQRQLGLEQAIDLLGIEHLLQRKPDRLSGGERQRVGIARALAVGPQLLLMDEPLAALDHKRRAEILPYLDRLHAELDIPIFYVSHAIDEVARLADHLVLMDAGRVLAHGPLPDMLARLDLPLPLGENAGVVLQGVVGERDEPWQLARLDVDGGGDRGGFGLWARDHGLPLGRSVRLRVLARDVSVTRAPQTGTSIGNQLRATVEAIADDEHPALALVRVRVGQAPGTPLVARLTRRSAHALELAPGMAVWAQVKTVALME